MRIGICTSAVTAALAFAVLSQPAKAMEGLYPFLPGVSVGVPGGALPPPGAYFNTFVNYFDFDLRDRNGHKTGVRVDETNFGGQLLWVPDLKIFGASYGAFVVQPFRAAKVRTPGGDSSGFDPINTVISPLNLSWNLQNGFFVSTGLTIYPKTYSFKRYRDDNVGRNYATIEPGVGLSYLKDGWNLSVHPLVDFNFKNKANDYKSGTLFLMDYTATKQFGKWELGLGGTLVEQLTNDKINGVTVARSPIGTGRGNRARQLVLGPVVGYNFGPFSAKLYYQRDIYAENTPGGNRYWFKLDVPLASQAPVAQAHDGMVTKY